MYPCSLPLTRTNRTHTPPFRCYPTSDPELPPSLFLRPPVIGAFVFVYVFVYVFVQVFVGIWRQGGREAGNQLV